jgi:hypothetical protein
VPRTLAGLVGVVAIGAVLLPIAGSAGADPIGATRDQISAQEQAVQAAAAHVHDLTIAYDQANLTASTLAQQVATDQVRITTLQTRAGQSEALLKREALLSYTGATDTLDVSAAASADPAIKITYMQVAAGDLNDTIDRYHTAARELASARSALQIQEAASRQAVQSVAQARQAAIEEASAVQTQLNQLQGQLARDVEAAEVAARRPAAPPASTTQGLPVNNGLLNVVHRIVAPTTTTTSAPTPSATAPSPTTGTTPPPTATPPTTPPTTTPPGGGLGGVWLQLRECESGDNYAENTGNGYYGAYQFDLGTWQRLGYPGRPDQAAPAVQDAAAQKLYSERGFAPWPATSRACGA